MTKQSIMATHWISLARRCGWVARPAIYVIGLLIGSCSLGGGIARANDKLTLQLGWIPTGERAQYFLAKEAGFFAAENLDVEILPGKGGADALAKTAAGSADLGESGFNSLLQARLTSDVPVKAVMAIHTKPLDGLITTKSAGITSIKDLVGKKVATSPFTSSNVHWNFLLKSNGVDPASVNLLKADATALVPMLASGRTDAIIMYYSNLPAVNSVLASAGKSGAALHWADYGLAGYENTLFASDRALASKRDSIVRFVRAVKKGEELMQKDPAQAANAIKAALPEVEVADVEATVKAALPAVFNENTTRDGLGVLTPALVNVTWEWVAKEEGVKPDALDPSSMVDYSIAK